MDSMKNLPEVMAHAHEDLLAHVAGQFSPEDWQQILNRAQERFEAHRQTADPVEAWKAVVREFHQERQWGFIPNYRPAKPERINLGVQFLGLAFLTFTISILAVVWLGQIYTASDEPADNWKFWGVVALVLLNFGAFLWRYQGNRD